MTTMDDLLIPQEMVDPRDLKPDPANPRVHQTERMRQGVKDWREAGVTPTGQYKGSIIVNKRTGYLVTGHGTVEALIANGAEKVQVGVIDVDEEVAREILLWDNWSSDNAENDERLLAELLAQLQQGGGLERTGFSNEDAENLGRLIETLDGGRLDDYDKEWGDSGMPDVDLENLKSKYRTVVHFRTEADMEAFFRKLDRPITSAGWWWPDTDGHVGGDASLLVHATEG